MKDAEIFVSTNAQSDVNAAFLKGLVFGFDVGTASIGYAVRRGREFLDVGVIICPEDTSDLRTRRGLRRQRRTLRSKKHRRQWLTAELEKLGLPKPPPNSACNPVPLRVRAASGEPLRPVELHAAIAHLWKRRGYLDHVPWSGRDEGENHEKEKGIIKASISMLREEMKADGCELPCHFLAKHPDHQRRRVWPRDLLKAEFDAIVNHHPKLAEKADWLLYGDTREVKNHHVYFKATEARNPGVLSLRWPRFDNRGPALDSWQPVDANGRPLHVVRKNKDAFKNAQWELALMNFRVLDAQTRQKRDPRIDFPDFVEALRKEWDKKAAKNKNFKIDLKKLARPYADKLLLIPEQKPLTPDGGAGRAKYASETLTLLRKEIGAGRRVDPPQPVLQRRGESWERALDRYITEIRHPLVRHRLVLFRRLLNQLIKDHSAPDLIVVEAVRSLALSQKNKNELNKRNEQFCKERDDARNKLKDAGQSVSATAIQKYRLWQEARGRCPFCLEAISQAGLLNGEADIEHLVPRSRLDCNEIYNLTIGHIQCNRNVKGDLTPYMAFCHSPKWEELKSNAAECFRGKKLEIFLSPNAEELIEQKAELVQTSYIAKVLRHVCLIRLGWLGDDGRDPTNIKAASSQRFQVTNGQLTSRLRQSWGLNHTLYGEPSEDNEAAWKEYTEKNRGDLRHHALDAMVISCTLPWLAHRTHGATDEFGNFGWWRQDAKGRSVASNPIDLDYDKARAEIKKVVVRHHASRSNHGKAFDTTFLGERKVDGKTVFAARKELTKITPDSLEKMAAKTLREYLLAAWKAWEAANPNWDAMNPRDRKGKLPQAFIGSLRDPTYGTPVKRVEFVVETSRSSVFQAMTHSGGKKAFVAYGENKEVRLHRHANGVDFVAVFVRPFYKRGEGPKVPPEAKAFVRSVHRGDCLRVHSPFTVGKRTYPPDWYWVVNLPGEADSRITVLPHFVAKSQESQKQIPLIRVDVCKLAKVIDFELPHPPFAQSESAGAVEA